MRPFSQPEWLRPHAAIAMHVVQGQVSRLCLIRLGYGEGGVRCGVVLESQ